MKPPKLSITFFVILLVSFFSLLAYAFKSDSPTDRLDDISSELAKIAKQQADLSWQIQALEMQYWDLQTEADGLNDEATSIFLSLIPTEKFEETEAEKKTEEQTDEWYPGKLSEDQTHQDMPELTWTTSHERFKEMAYDYGLDASTFYKVEDAYGVKEWVILCITIAETSGGNRGYAKSNPGNVGNNDRWDRVTYTFLETGLEAIGKTLNNQYLGSHYTLGCLSNAWSCQEPTDNNKRYATSTSSWEKNMVACLSDIYGEQIDPSTFNFRR